ncbi:MULTISPECIES: hypothetical protein [unclassified Mesorhizobium]|uniref:hypothetical protein n=1 Tax=unclassified Mesorhizobium TaxID=325217 RepID=UPI001093F5B0|nr:MULTISPECIES: hypothetical protein [unclassified Mesorhizobium]TGS46022.1 hypothetical protein EN825_10375 [Mesorhizobium sp. M8A.F.Ca.ET.182.01.1.1]TGS81477.1 hypothetical protein EN824_10590 [Mesorhizobium sp. M8A.F.Ca.ET.181.01.1.1]
MTLMSPTEYAHAIGVSPSTVSRAIAKGRIPTVTTTDGKRMVDRQTADTARRRDSNIQGGHGGRSDRAVRKASLWRAQSGNGYDPQVLAALSVMVLAWPSLMREAMEILGADEMNQARAVLALEDLTATLACAVHQDINRARIHDYRIPLPAKPIQHWSAEVQAFVDRVGDNGMGGQWTSDDVEGLSGGAEWAERTMSACWSVQP